MRAPQIIVDTTQSIPLPAANKTRSRVRRTAAQRRGGFETVDSDVTFDIQAAPPQENLYWPVQPQQKSEWCWAAVAVSLAARLSPPADSQCSLASRVTGEPCCPVDSYTGPAGNSPQILGDVLLAVGLPTTTDGPVGLDVLKEHVGGHRRPVPVQIRWKDTDETHYVYIDGYVENLADPEQSTVQVRDPIAGTRQLWLWQLTSDYPPSRPGSVRRGEWYGTFLLQPGTG